MSAFRDAITRRRQELNPLTTSAPLIQQPFAAPQAGGSLSSPFGHHPTSYSPASAARHYNPQQWGSSALGQDTNARYSPVPDAVPGPPPYSPPRSNRPPTTSPDEPTTAHRVSPAVTHRPSPEVPAAPIFPPPPGTTRTRALSRDRPQALFNLGAFTRRNAGPDPARVSPPATREPAPSSRALTHFTVEPIHQQEDIYDAPRPVRPPASRRAASTGAIETPTSSYSIGHSSARWEPGMPLPPPPPGPPPFGSRSQSMTRAPESSSSQPTRRPQTISALGPIPPTPAGWVDGDVSDPRGRSPNPELQVDTSAAAAMPQEEVHSGNSSSGLSRAPAVRGEPRSIRERRSESRSGRALNTEIRSNNPWAGAITPSDITVPPVTELSRRPVITKSTPRSARSSQLAEIPNSENSLGQSTPTRAAFATESRGGTPRPPSSSNIEAPTPPFSPNNYHVPHNDAPHVPPKSLPTPPVPPKSLPTPPPQPRRGGSPSVIKSRALYSPNGDSGTILLSSRKPASSRNSSENRALTDFSFQATQRHDEFAEQESAATTDEERVRLFANFIVTESRLRRDRYASAIDAMGSEILDLTRDLFRPLSRAERESLASKSDKTDRQPISRPGSSSGLTSASPPHNESNYFGNGYRPSLSPIASMATSDAQDESSSRGRTPSRWWEASHSGPRSPGGALARSKRESKYMGVPPEARESLQWEGSGPPSSAPTVAGPSSHTSYGADEYPPEKAGWHDQEMLSSTPHGKTPTNVPFRSCSPAPPATPNPKHLDVSRLVTLPPPYPRHHPAVNNNHPDLTGIRNAVRALSDFTEVEATKDRFNEKSKEMREAAVTAAAQRKQALRTKISREIESGTMSYADAAKAEAEAVGTEAEATKAQSKASFDLLQTSVISPLNDLLMGRIHRATALFEQLRSQLFVDAQEQSPNMPQEEGDEQPELLEKLTLLKWIFEARECLHREIHDLLTDRNDRYKDMVIEPYRLAGNDAKVVNAEQFFASDGRKRVLEFETQSLTRTVEFMDVVESNVVRGVEVQLGAFWDIAPSLRKIIEKVPKVLTRDFGVVIPKEEYDENPDYTQFPLQYLYHLLEHGKKSTYQFIESQINLLCLLHEVKNAVAAVRGRVEKSEAEGQEEQVRMISEGVEREEKRLTDDLKEKVRCVEELWDSAIGAEFATVKGRVKDFLVHEGGWDGVEDLG